MISAAHHTKGAPREQRRDTKKAQKREGVPEKYGHRGTKHSPRFDMMAKGRLRKSET